MCRKKERMKMLKIFKKVAALLLAVALLVPGFTSAFANPANLSGHPAPDELGSITINVRTVDSDEVPTGGLTPPVTIGVPIENVPIRIELVTLNLGVPAPTAQQLQSSAWILENTTRTGTYHDLLTNANGVAIFPNLPQGIWLVEQLDDLGTVTNPIPEDERFDTFLVGLPTHRPLLPGDPGFNPDEDTYIFDLHPVVWPKVDRERLTGGNKTAIANFDNIITWEFGVDIPASIGTAREFYLLDLLDERLEFISGSVTGRFTPNTGTDPFRPLTGTGANPHFTATVHSVAVAGGTNDVVRIALTPAGIAYIAANGDLVDGRLYFRMDTGLTIEENEDLGMIRNDAVWRYNPDEPWDPADPYDPWEECPPTDPNYPTCIPDDRITTTVTTFALNILKLSVGARQPLQGAEFSIYREVSEGTIGATTFSVTRNGTTTTHHVIPLSNADGSPMTGETNASGILQFDGINSTGQTFWLRETEAPTGFRVIHQWMEVSVTQGNANSPLRDANNEIQDPVNGVGYIIPVNVYNERQRAWRLPETGGIGTIILTVAGVGLLGGSLVLFVGSKKEEEEEELT